MDRSPPGTSDRSAYAGPVLVTGAASGIGRAIALELARRKVPGLALIDRDPVVSEVARAAGALTGKVETAVVDVGDEDEVGRAVARLAADLSYLGGLVNCAGILGQQATVSEASADDWREVLRVNLLGPVFVTAAALPFLLKAPGRRASIVNITSVVALEGAPRHPAYAASKAALWSLTMSLARELAPRGVRVNAIAPGSVLGTGLSRGAPNVPRPTPESLAALMASIPLKRLPNPVEIARSAAFLLSDEAAHITGTAMVADGGERWRLPL